MDGFLPFSRATLMLDLVSVAMLFVLPLMTWNIWLVRVRKNYRLHKKVFVVLGIVLASLVLIFEIDMRVTGWRDRAEPSPYYSTWLFPVLYVHLFFAINTLFLWVVTILKAVRGFSDPPKPGSYSPKHKLVARYAAGFMYITACTGWTFYYLAFVA